jgi:hypothetical protein
MDIAVIKRRITRLRAIVNHPTTSKEEGEAAQGRIVALMARYKLKEEDVASEKIEIITHSAEINIQALWPRALAGMLAGMYNVESLVVVPPDNLEFTTALLFSGYKEDLDKFLPEWRSMYQQMLQGIAKLREQIKNNPMPMLLNFNGFMFNIVGSVSSEVTFEQEDSWGYGALTALGQKLKQREHKTATSSQQESKKPDTNKTSQPVAVSNALVPTDAPTRAETVRDFIRKNMDVVDAEEVKIKKQRIIDKRFAQQGYSDGYNLRLGDLVTITREKSDEKL